MSEMGWRYLQPADKAAILAGIRDGVAYGGPYHVEIYPADRCNIDCFFCSTAVYRGTDELPFQRFEELIGEMAQAGTRSVRFGGGGEAMFHRRFKEILQRLIDVRLPVESITTNAVLIGDEMAELLAKGCDEITVSLNTVTAESYARMMRTTERNYQRVLENIRRQISVRNALRAKGPRVRLQFLVWRENYRMIPEMYALGRELGVDDILFNGLSWLPADQQMTDEQRAEMMTLYEQVAREDEFRVIRTITSFEKNIAPEVEALVTRLAAERNSKSLLERARLFLERPETLNQKVRHHLEVRRSERTRKRSADFVESCIMAWVTLVIRSEGSVAPCCILQEKKLGNIFEHSLHDVWHSQAYAGYRRELTRIIADPPGWKPGSDDVIVGELCGMQGQSPCPMKGFFYRGDASFVEELSDVFSQVAAAHRMQGVPS
jgi:MoaA/NifB/PqqE/SkfB family radical SAM enzyme